MGLFTALAITIHNFPEGIATFFAALDDPGVGVAIAVAVALHNIPEGISVSVPIYYATGSRRRAFTLSFLSGLAEPVGAVAVYVALRPVITPTLMGVLFGMVAGIMVYISLDEAPPHRSRARPLPRGPDRPLLRHGGHGGEPPPPRLTGAAGAMPCGRSIPGGPRRPASPTHSAPIPPSASPRAPTICALLPHRSRTGPLDHRR